MILGSVCLLCALTPLVVAEEPSLLAPPNGELTRRCLPESHESIIPDIALMPVLLEENNWASHYLVSMIAAIIIREHLGYNAKFNVANTLSRVFDRAAFPGERSKEPDSDFTVWKEGDGEQLQKVMASSKNFVYINMEVWSGTKLKKLAKFVENRGTAKNVGAIGYMGRDGWYVPRWIVDRCGALAYPSWLPGMDTLVRKAYNYAGEMRSPMNATEETCFGKDKDCTLWFPSKNSTTEHIIVHIVPGYGGSTNHDMVTYNNLNIALFGRGYSDQFAYVTKMLAGNETNPFCSQQQAAEETAAAVAFYHWEPSNAFTASQWNNLERLMMPARDCDLSPKCDFPPNRLLKVSSVKYEQDAPLLDQFLKKMSLSRKDIDRLLSELVDKGGSSSGAVFEVACGWVQANQDTWASWSVDRDAPFEVPFYAYVWNPLVFFATFLTIVISMVVWCLGFESCFITGHPFRTKAGYKLGLLPAMSVAKLVKKKKPPPTWQEFQAKQTIGGLGESIVIFASPLFYDDPVVDPLHIQIALLRLGRCDEEAAICIETSDCTAKAGVNYRAVKCAVNFQQGERIKWLSIPRIANVNWMTETYFRVIITTVISGHMVLGGLSQCTVIVTDRRVYPGLTHPAKIDTLQGRSAFLRGLMQQFLFAHGKKDELKRAAWICYEAVFAVIVRTWLYNNWLLGVVIGQRFYEGLFLVIGLEALDAVCGRSSDWRQKITGTGSIRKHIHNQTLQKIVRPFTHNLSSDIEGVFVSAHLCAIDKGINEIYGSLYALYKGALVIGLSCGFILSGAMTGHYLLLIYRFAPILLMLPLCLYFGFGWQKAWRWDLQMVHEGTLQKRVNQAMWLMKVRTTMRAYGTGFLSTAYDEDFRKALNAEFRDAGLEGLHDFDSMFLSSYFADFVILGLYCSLVLVHMESKTYGAGGFGLPDLLATIRVYTMLKGAILSISVNCRAIEDGIAGINCARGMLDEESKIDSLKEQLQQRLQRFHMEPNSKLAPRLPDKLTINFLNCVVEAEGKTRKTETFTFNGSVPLGRLYLMTSHETKVEQDIFLNTFQGMNQPINGCVDLPPWIRCIALFGEKMPQLFHISPIDNALVFADRRKYGEAEAKSMLNLFDCFTGGNLSKAVDPDSVSFEDSFLLALIQAILADPEVLLFDKPLSLLHVKRHHQVLHALVSWQDGGPRAILKSAQKRTTEVPQYSKADFPEWCEPTGSIRRTLILNTHGASAIVHAGDHLDQPFDPQTIALENGQILIKHNKGHLASHWERFAMNLLRANSETTLEDFTEMILHVKASVSSMSDFRTAIRQSQSLEASKSSKESVADNFIDVSHIDVGNMSEPLAIADGITENGIIPTLTKTVTDFPEIKDSSAKTTAPGTPAPQSAPQSASQSGLEMLGNAAKRAKARADQHSRERKCILD